MSVRLFHRGARWVLVVRRTAAGEESWWAPHRALPDWQAIVARQLRLLGLAAEPAGDAPGLITPLGQIRWKGGRYWSIIRLRLDSGSEIKRRLVAAALLKAARYSRTSA